MQRPIDALYRWIEQNLDVAALPLSAPLPELEAIADRFGDNPELNTLLEDMAREERAIYDLILRRTAPPHTQKLRVAVALTASIAYQRGLTMSEPRGGRDGGQPEPQGF